MKSNLAELDRFTEVLSKLLCVLYANLPTEPSDFQKRLSQLKRMSTIVRFHELERKTNDLFTKLKDNVHKLEEKVHKETALNKIEEYIKKQERLLKGKVLVRLKAKLPELESRLKGGPTKMGKRFSLKNLVREMGNHGNDQQFEVVLSYTRLLRQLSVLFCSIFFPVLGSLFVVMEAQEFAGCDLCPGDTATWRILHL